MAVKAAYEAIASRLAAPVGRRLHRRDAIVLAYHNVVPDDAAPAGDRSLHLSRSRFATQLDRLEETHDVVPLSELRGPGSGRPRAAITFDDGYRGAVTLGVQELLGRGLPATIFVCPGFDADHAFWWDELAGSGGLAPATREHCIGTLSGDTEAIRQWAERQGLRAADVPPYMRSASVAELRQATTSGRITLGSHTWTHPNLSAVDPPRLRFELEQPLEWLRQHFPTHLAPWVSYPYGHVPTEALRHVPAAGYTGGFRVDGGWVTRRSSDPLLPRLNIPAGISTRGFEIRTSALRARG